MEQLTNAGRACAVAAAAAHDFNNELTVILSGVSEALDALPAEDPARELSCSTFKQRRSGVCGKHQAC